MISRRTIRLILEWVAFGMSLWNGILNGVEGIPTFLPVPMIPIIIGSIILLEFGWGEKGEQE